MLMHHSYSLVVTEPAEVFKYFVKILFLNVGIKTISFKILSLSVNGKMLFLK